jgi:hypothetical protein
MFVMNFLRLRLGKLASKAHRDDFIANSVGYIVKAFHSVNNCRSQLTIGNTANSPTVPGAWQLSYD